MERNKVQEVLEYLSDKCLPDHVAWAHTRVSQAVHHVENVSWNESAWDCIKQHYDFLKSR